MSGINRKTYSEQVVEHIMHSLKTGKLQPGDKITELAIAQELSISQAPVREAFQVLISRGLVRQKGRSGKYITKLTPKEIRDSYFAGGVLEGSIVASAADLFTREDVGSLGKIVVKMKEEAHGDADTDRLAELDVEFHNLLLSKGNNEIVRELWFRSCQAIGKLLFYAKWKEMFDPSQIHLRHKRILDAVRSKDPSLIEQTIRDHYTSAGEIISRHAAESYSPSESK
jgi:GntR family transcriptional regulator, rspAB operon transcriptional repressor